MMLDFFKAMRCFLVEFWPALEDEPFTSNKTLEALLTDSGVKPHCGHLLQGTHVCYIRTDKVGTGCPGRRGDRRSAAHAVVSRLGALRKLHRCSRGPPAALQLTSVPALCRARTSTAARCRRCWRTA